MSAVIRVTNPGGDAYSPQIAELRAVGAPIPEPSLKVSGLFAAGLLLRRTHETIPLHFRHCDL